MSIRQRSLVVCIRKQEEKRFSGKLRSVPFRSCDMSFDIDF